MAITQEQAQSVSTHAQVQLLRGENMDTFTTTYNDSWVDPLTPQMLDTLDRMRSRLKQYKYVGGTPMTTVSFDLYGTTSAWWIILYLNGYMHPDEISDGITLKVPDILDIQSMLRLNVIDNVGRVVVT